MPHQEIAQRLNDAHRNMERVLTLMRFQVDSLREGGNDQGLTLMGNAIGYLRNYPGVNHHPTEELIFSKLTQYAPEARMACNRLSRQHHGFERQEVTMLWHLRAVKRGDADARQQVRDMSMAYCADHSRHIHSEEVEVFPQAARCLSAADWKDVEEHANQINDPVFEQNELRRFDNLFEYLMKAGRRFKAN